MESEIVGAPVIETTVGSNVEGAAVGRFEGQIVGSRVGL